MNMRNVAGHLLAASVVGLLSVSQALAAVCTHTGNFPSQHTLTGRQADGSNCGTNSANVSGGIRPDGNKVVACTLLNGTRVRTFGLDANNNVISGCLAQDLAPGNPGDTEVGGTCNSAVRWRANLFF